MSRISIFLPQSCGYHAFIRRRRVLPGQFPGFKSRMARSLNRKNTQGVGDGTDPFVSSAPNTLGIELELQLVDPRSFDLAAASDELLAQLANHPIADRVKPEITRSMIELNSSVHEHPAGLLAEMREMRDVLCEAADAVGVGVTGGGAHPSCVGRTAPFPIRRASSTWPRCTATWRASSRCSASISTWACPPATRRCAWCAGCRRMFQHFIVPVGRLALLRRRGHPVFVLPPQCGQQLPAGRPHARRRDRLVPLRGPPGPASASGLAESIKDLYVLGPKAQ